MSDSGGIWEGVGVRRRKGKYGVVGIPKSHSSDEMFRSLVAGSELRTVVDKQDTQITV